MIRKRKLSEKGEKVSEQIVQVTIKLFAKYGFDQTSFQKIADQCGLSQTSVLYYFPNRFSLLEGVIDRIVKDNFKSVNSAISPNHRADQKLDALFIQQIKWAVESREQVQVILLLYYYASFKGKFMKLYSGIRMRSRARIAEYLLAGQREGVFTQDLDIDKVSANLQDLLLGGIVNLITVAIEPKDVSRETRSLKRRWKQFFKAYLVTRATD